MGNTGLRNLSGLDRYQGCPVLHGIFAGEGKWQKKMGRKDSVMEIRAWNERFKWKLMSFEDKKAKSLIYSRIW